MPPNNSLPRGLCGTRNASTAPSAIDLSTLCWPATDPTRRYTADRATASFSDPKDSGLATPRLSFQPTGITLPRSKFLSLMRYCFARIFTFFRILEFLRFSYASRNFSLQIFDQIKLNRNLNSRLQFFIFISLSKEYLFSRAKLKIFSSLPFTTRLLFSWKIRFSVAGKWIEKKRIRLRTTTTIIQLALFYSPPLTRARIVSASMQSLRSGRSGATGTGARVAAILCTLPSR